MRAVFFLRDHFQSRTKRKLMRKAGLLQTPTPASRINGAAPSPRINHRNRIHRELRYPAMASPGRLRGSQLQHHIGCQCHRPRRHLRPASLPGTVHPPATEATSELLASDPIRTFEELLEAEGQLKNVRYSTDIDSSMLAQRKRLCLPATSPIWPLGTGDSRFDNLPAQIPGIHTPMTYISDSEFYWER
ncbi:uncharacterized protein K452DRAFT_96521 [Aplosporella prunicola CBS 121167]|uniref:Uncharacterized protein n=1 Tax=Aplosporella prunicola CBS 121167 TaxID=1176127 RepID=A0A6A6B1G9_9PEZI|nr:uncharacterized protein K452DRAFT_96521 [Aplosporella prunicola CBS 121167]KAF2137890.1 hypothetical protein K452DRAFT_96521 [Aplosporella prunicola CBS 121167]